VEMREIPSKILQTFREGTVIPILPLALADPRRIDEERQRALVRYYIDAGAGGIAVAFPPGETRKQAGALFAALRPLASEAADRWSERKGRQTFKLAEVAGKTREAVEAAESAYREGYHACLVDLSAPREGAIRSCSTTSALSRRSCLSWGTSAGTSTALGRKGSTFGGSLSRSTT